MVVLRLLIARLVQLNCAFVRELGVEVAEGVAHLHVQVGNGLHLLRLIGLDRGSWTQGVRHRPWVQTALHFIIVSHHGVLELLAEALSLVEARLIQVHKLVNFCLFHDLSELRKHATFVVIREDSASSSNRIFF